MKPVDIIGAEEMLTGMANSPTAAAPRVAAKVAADLNVGSVVSTAVGTGGHVQTAAEAWGDLAMHPVKNATDFWGWLDLDLGSWFDGMNDWLHHLTWATPLAGLTHFLSGGLLTWLTAAFLGFRIFSMARGIATPGRWGPVKLIYYQVPTKATESVTSYLKGAHQIEVRDVQKTNETHSLIGIPIYHSGKSSRAFSTLSKQTGLEYTKL